MRSRLIAYAGLPHFTPLAGVVVITGLLIWIIGVPPLDGARVARMLLAMLGGQIVIGVVNELVDVDIDRVTKPSKPIPAGLVSVRGAVLMGCAGAILMLTAGWPLGVRSFLILVIGTGLGVAYSLWFKRTPYAWLPYLAALPLLPIWVAVTLDRFEPALILLYPLGAIGVLGVQMAQSLPDVAADRAAGIDTLTTRLGERRSLVVIWAAIVGSAVLAMIGSVAQDTWSWRIWVAALGVLLAVGFDVALYRRSPRSGVMAAFPCAAGSLAVLAIAWIVSIYR
jgi:4-hydroxybenzoate polyprenyltransferase